MAVHLSKDVIAQMVVSRESVTAFSKHPVTMKGIDLDACHRKFRIMYKHGLMRRTENAHFYMYSITSKGRSFLLDRSRNNK